MKTMSKLAVAACCAVIASTTLHAATDTSGPLGAAVIPIGSSDGGSLPGLPGGRGGATGGADATPAPEPAAAGGEDLLRYCVAVLNGERQGNGQFRPSQCAGLFSTEAEPGQPGRGGNGGGVAGLPGGRGGASGNAAEPSDDASRAALKEYCVEVLRAPDKAPASEKFEPGDCADYFAALGNDGEPAVRGKTGSRGGSGADGASVSGGVGGKGGRAGSGPGAGRGGAGGAGVAGGSGGAGGAGGSSN